MFPSALLTTLAALATTVVATPIVVRENPITLPFVRKLNVKDGHDLLAKDRARVKSLHTKALTQAATGAVVSVDVTNVATVYIASVGVGSPATTFDLLIDTGSSNTWVGAGTPFTKTGTTIATPDTVSVTYGSGSFSGNEFLDQVTIAPGLVIHNQSIGVATTSTGFAGVDGILGIGPVDLTVGTLSPATTQSIPTVTDNLFSQGTITQDEIGISFEPTTSLSNENGELTFGGTDSSKFTGSLTFIPLTTTFPASEFWGIDQTITFGTTTIQGTAAGIVDTGTTLVLLAPAAFSAYQKATGAVADAATGLLRVTTTQFNNLKDLNFNAGGATFSLTPNAQIWPRALNTAIGGEASRIYLIVNSLGSTAETGFDFVNGFTFLERFYAVFNTANKQVGLAQTPFTNATSN